MPRRSANHDREHHRSTGAKISSIRENLELTLKALSKQSKIGYSTLWNWEDSGVPNANSICALCESLQITPNELFGFDTVDRQAEITGPERLRKDFAASGGYEIRQMDKEIIISIDGAAQITKRIWGLLNTSNGPVSVVHALHTTEGSVTEDSLHKVVTWNNIPKHRQGKVVIMEDGDNHGTTHVQITFPRGHRFYDYALSYPCSRDYRLATSRETPLQYGWTRLYVAKPISHLRLEVRFPESYHPSICFESAWRGNFPYSSDLTNVTSRISIGTRKFTDSLDQRGFRSLLLEVGNPLPDWSYGVVWERLHGIPNSETDEDVVDV